MSLIGRSSSLRCSDVAGMFCGFFHKGLNDVRIYPWDTSVRPYSIPKGDSVVSNIERLSRIGGGGTNMSCAPHLMVENGVKRDRFIFITDSEEFVGRIGWGGTSWIDAWRLYRKTVNAKAEAFLIRIDPYGTNPFSDEAARKYGIHQIYGWNDSVVRYMHYILSH